MARALICLLAVTFAQGYVVPSEDISSTSSMSYTLYDSILNIMNNPSPVFSLKGMMEERLSTDDWDKEIDIPIIGLHVKIKFVDTANIFKGGRVFIEFPIPKMLTYFTMGVTDVQIDLDFLGKDMTMGLFEVKMGYKMMTTTTGTKEGSVWIVRERESDKVVTHVTLNGKKITIVDIALDTDYINKLHLVLNLGYKNYELTINRMQGPSFSICLMVDGVEYDTVASLDCRIEKVSIHHSVNNEKKYQTEIILNPLTQEWGVILIGNVEGPLDCRIVLDKELKFAHLIVNHNGVTCVMVKVEGNVEKSSNSLIPASVKYSVTYKFSPLVETVKKIITHPTVQSYIPQYIKQFSPVFESVLDVVSGGVLEIDYNEVEKQKALTITLVPYKGHPHMFELKGKLDDNFSHSITHKLLCNNEIVYTMTHTHSIATLNTEKWMSVMKDTCTVPVTSPLYKMLKSTYLGKLLNMQRKASINIDYRMKNGLTVPKIDYTDVVMVKGEKHLEITLNTEQTPFSISIYYPTGPEILGYNVGFKSLLGQESVTASITLTSNMEMIVKTNVYNIKISLRGPHKDFKSLVSAEISYTEKNEKVFEFTLYKEGKTVKVHLFSSFFLPKSLSACFGGKSCSSQLSGHLNLELNFANMIIYSLLPAHTFSMGITKDFKHLIEIQHSMNQLPYTLSVSCPALLAQPLVIKATQETLNTVAVQLSHFLNQDVKITTIGTVSTISYDETSLVHLDVDFLNKKIIYSLSGFVKPIVSVSWTISNTITKNNVIIEITLPEIALPEITLPEITFKTNMNYDITTLYKCNVKATISGELPVLGAHTCNHEFTTDISGKTGKINYQGSSQFTSGPLVQVSPITNTVTASYNLDTFTVQSEAMAHVADKTVGFKVIDNKIVLVY